jgi:hypothetical protein
MTSRPTFQLSRLREIGWSTWDPIGVGGPEDGWPADEYDRYLLEAAGRLWHGQSVQEVADYLVEIETMNMGLTGASDAPARAVETARTMRVYVRTLRA